MNRQIQMGQRNKFGDVEVGFSDNLLGNNLPVHVRHDFIRKVYGILSAQLVFTFAIGYGIYKWVGGSTGTSHSATFQGLLIASLLLYVALICSVACVPSLLRKSPLNLFILGGISLCLGVLVGTICTQYSPGTIAMAGGLTIAITVSLSLFACQTRYDFTGMGSYVFGACIALICVSILASFFRSDTTALVVASLYLVFFSMFLVYDTQLIIGGNDRKRELSVDDYAAGALALYIDIIQIFINLLQILGYVERN